MFPTPITQAGPPRQAPSLMPPAEIHPLHSTEELGTPLTHLSTVAHVAVETRHSRLFPVFQLDQSILSSSTGEEEEDGQLEEETETGWAGEGSEHGVIGDGRPFQSHTASRTWLSAGAKEFERFSNTKTAMERMVPQSDIVPRNFGDWIAHRLGRLDDHSEYYRKRLDEILRKKDCPRVKPAFGGKRFQDGRCAVLSLESVWSDPPKPSGKELAPWPSHQEMKWEGEDRAKTNVGRFPPLPRERANETVAWHQLRPVKPWPLDAVRKVPTAEDVKLSQEPEEPMPTWLINDSLWKAIDA